MQLSICTISFRHQLISIDELANWAQANHFHALELWGIHAKNLADNGAYNKDWIQKMGLRISMLSDYLPLSGDIDHLQERVNELARLTRHWGAGKLRTFAGSKGSFETSSKEQQFLVSRLQQVCDWLSHHHLDLIIEVHPQTFADTVESTELLLREVDRPNIKLNFDVLHVWESGADIQAALDQLHCYISHFHFKNIRSAEFLDVFAPENVYAAAGSREGMTSLFDGAVDYRRFLKHLYNHPNKTLATMDASLEWFGHNSQKVINRDRYLIQQQLQQTQLQQPQLSPTSPSPPLVKKLKRQFQSM